VAEAPDLDAVDLEQLAELIEAFDGVLESDDPELERLPEGVPEPGHYEGEPQRRADSLSRCEAGLAVFRHDCTSGMSASPSKADISSLLGMVR